MGDAEDRIRVLLEDHLHELEVLVLLILHWVFFSPRE